MAEEARVHAKTQESKQKFSSPYKQNTSYNSSRSPADRILQLQRTAGNQAVQRLIKSGSLQGKFEIGQPYDQYEQEADRVAEQVMRMSDTSYVPKSPVNSLSEGLSIQSITCSPERDIQSKEEDDEKKEIVQMKQSSPPYVADSLQNVLPSVKEVLSSPGFSLDPATREYMEPRFGHDFSGVRVHLGAIAEQSAREVNAHAYTVGHNIVFGAGRFMPGTHQGRQLLAHELTHVVQQSGSLGTLQRTPAAPRAGARSVPFDRSKVDVFAIPDIRTDTDLQRLVSIAKLAFVNFIDPNIKGFSSTLYDPADRALTASGISPVPGGRLAFFPLFANPVTSLTQGRHILRCIGYDSANQPVAYADRSFYVWTSKPTGKPPDIAALEAEKTALEATTKVGSGKTIGEVGSAFTRLKDVSHDLAVLEKGTGVYVGNQCSVVPAGVTPTDCTNIVLEVLENAFTQQGRGADWIKVKKKYMKNIGARGGKTGLSGLDVQAALQSEAGWKGIYWAPDPEYKIPKEELAHARSDEAGYTAGIAKRRGTYMKDYGKKGYPGLSINYSVTNYSPESPKPGYGEASKTKKDTTMLDKLKKLPFGVLSAHGGYHMTLITYGKVIEVHWDKEATDIDLIERTDLETWAVGSRSGFHYYASGAIVAPAADVDAAFK